MKRNILNNNFMNKAALELLLLKIQQQHYLIENLMFLWTLIT